MLLAWKHTSLIIPPLNKEETTADERTEFSRDGFGSAAAEERGIIIVQLRFIVDGVITNVEWALVALDGDAFDTKMRNHLEHKYNLKDIDRLVYSGVNGQEVGHEDEMWACWVTKPKGSIMNPPSCSMSRRRRIEKTHLHFPMC